MVYGDLAELRRPENKANQSQYAGLWPEIRNGFNGGRITMNDREDG